MQGVPRSAARRLRDLLAVAAVVIAARILASSAEPSRCATWESNPDTGLFCGMLWAEETVFIGLVAGAVVVALVAGAVRLARRLE